MSGSVRPPAVVVEGCGDIADVFPSDDCMPFYHGTGGIKAIGGELMTSRGLSLLRPTSPESKD
jgi:hypothetical protein